MGYIPWQFGQSNFKKAIVIRSRNDFRIDGCRQKNCAFKIAVLDFCKPVGGVGRAMPGKATALNSYRLAVDFDI